MQKRHFSSIVCLSDSMSLVEIPTFDTSIPTTTTAATTETTTSPASGGDFWSFMGTELDKVLNIYKSSVDTQEAVYTKALTYPQMIVDGILIIVGGVLAYKLATVIITKGKKR